MASPTVFVSSTFYDLRYAREALKRFIEALGYIAVLSEEGAVFYDPKTHTVEACKKEVHNADLLVLLIGGRYGSLAPDETQSVTNGEYVAAVAKGIPVFALVEQGTYNDYQLYRANASDKELLERLSFPNADNVKIFEFIDQVQGQATNNALVPFQTVSDIEIYLRSQWAGMMHSFLTRDARTTEVVDNLELLQLMNERIEVITSQILQSVGSPTDRLTVRLLHQMLQSAAMSDMRFIGARPTPAAVLSNSTLVELAASLGRPMNVEEKSESSISGSGDISASRLETGERDYSRLQDEMRSALAMAGVTEEEYLEHEKTHPIVTDEGVDRDNF
ncbi:DUF4062 domain-containing protein [Knoellia sp. S7-12]|uniref:DUF4062 domain-containing protein n=1 Tax=Knoellia sp. S7-12 TaxID=3126698 RepID=UPI003365DB03